MVLGVAQALQDYEQRLRDLGATVVTHLQPGLTADEIDELETEHDLKLPSDARAIWQWHHMPAPTGPVSPYELTPGMRFLGLCEALQLSRTLTRTHNPIVEQDGATHLRWEPSWVPLTTDGKTIITIDCSRPRADTSRTMLFSTGGDTNAYIQLPLLNRVQWWLWALDHHAWTVRADGGWELHRDRYPSGPGLENILV